MPALQMQFTTSPPRLTNSLPGSLIDGVINGAISCSVFSRMAQVPLSVDSIAARRGRGREDLCVREYRERIGVAVAIKEANVD